MASLVEASKHWCIDFLIFSCIYIANCCKKEVMNEDLCASFFFRGR